MSDAPASVTARREARERALSLLYEAESRGQPVAQIVADLPIPPARFALDIVDGVAAHLDEIDELLDDHAHGWTVDRMAAIDRAILRIAVYELSHHADVPTGVVISEAVELASAYSTERSTAFVNGLLAAAAEELRPGPAD
ncbi:MAG: transcription antitermination factor NusB [Acidimicrobiia bacterium]|nr:transcription antitermination factor NusB [Acidimicrobiia bacterium]